MTMAPGEELSRLSEVTISSFHTFLNPPYLIDIGYWDFSSFGKNTIMRKEYNE
jgi:hypothetical protein